MKADRSSPRSRSDIVGLRVVLAHHYHRIDPELVWRVASVELPRLLAALQEGRA
jgi:uncharacterized protein with HEPN domain